MSKEGLSYYVIFIDVIRRLLYSFLFKNISKISENLFETKMKRKDISNNEVRPSRHCLHKAPISIVIDENIDKNTNQFEESLLVRTFIEIWMKRYIWILLPVVISLKGKC